ncbi:MAG: hypothetical protein MI739_00675 [Bacteroidales bacterium]|nr:hypothetical protein [Bacteroidales bacterium]
MKELINLQGSKILCKKEQQSVKGGGHTSSFCQENGVCPDGQHCEGIVCVPDQGSGGSGGGEGEDPNEYDPK